MVCFKGNLNLVAMGLLADCLSFAESLRFWIIFDSKFASSKPAALPLLENSKRPTTFNKDSLGAESSIRNGDSAVGQIKKADHRA